MLTGIYGGSFDPVHNAHLQTIRYVLDEVPLDRLLVIPAGLPPHKQGNTYTAEKRLAMLNTAIETLADPRIIVSDYEIRQTQQTGQKNYTIDTVRALKHLYPDDQFYLVIGTDMLLYLPHWYKIDELYSLVKIILIPRRGTPDNSETLNNIDTLKYPPSIIISRSPDEISSTEIRRRIIAGESLDELVPQCIIELL